jgi:hypothetical protein
MRRRLGLLLLLGACSSGPPAQRFTIDEDTVLEAELEISGGEPVLAEAPSHGTASLAGGARFAYAPDPDFSGDDRFAVTAGGARHEVRIAIRAVNDAPRLAAVQFRPQVDGRAGVSLPVAISDPDSPAWSVVSVAQVSGPPLAGLSLGASALAFDAPAVEKVTPVTVAVVLRDDAGLAGETRLEVGLRPLSAGGRVKTLQGGPGEPGVHLVIVGDGYAAADVAALHEHADRALKALLTTAPLARVNAAWNIHLYELISAESGVDDVAAGVYRDTALDSAIRCTSAPRQVCGSPTKDIAALDAAFPAWNLALKILHTAHCAGSGSEGFARGMASVTACPAMEAYVVHELGHGHAGLADEYEGASPGTPPPPDLADRYPNISLTDDPEQVKWRRWLDVPGVGLFEGGYYRPDRVWRPTQSSFMRAQGNPVDPIGAEAWAVATYARAGGAILSASPAPGAVRAAAGAPVEVSLRTLHAGEEQSVRWWLNDEEVPAARGRRTFTLSGELAGTHVLRAQVRDATGLIRLPDAPPHAAEASWTVTFDLQ